MSWTVIGAGANVTQLIEEVFDIPSSSMLTVHGEILMVLNVPVSGDINFLSKSVANLPAAEVAICWQSMYAYCPA